MESWHTLACACWPPYLVAVKVPGPWGGSGGWQGLLAVGSFLTSWWSRKMNGEVRAGGVVSGGLSPPW